MDGCGCKSPKLNVVADRKDDASRLAFTARMPDEKKEGAVAFLHAAIAWFRAHDVTAQRVMTDNGEVLPVFRTDG